MPGGELSTLIPGPYTFEYQDAVGGVLSQQSFSVSFDLEESAVTQTPFVFTIPYITGTAKIVVKQNGVTKAEKIVRANAPTVTVATPNGGEQLAGQTTIQWIGNDVDGNPLSYAILYSPDNGTTWTTLATNVTATSYLWNLAGLSTGTQYRVKVIATDGFNTGQDASNASFAISGAAQLYLPMVVK